jgi:DNA-binding NtrC family response regulator
MSEIVSADQIEISVRLGTPMREIEQLIIEQVIGMTGGSIAKAAAKLDLSFATVYRRIQSYKAKDMQDKHEGS